MDQGQKQIFIQMQAIKNKADPIGTKIIWSRHAIAEMLNDKLNRTMVEVALAQCEIIEDYPHNHRPLPDCLVLAKLRNGQPLHAVIAVDIANDRILVITVYLPSAERWEHDWRTRK